MGGRSGVVRRSRRRRGAEGPRVGTLKLLEPPRRVRIHWEEGSSFPASVLEATFEAHGRDRVIVSMVHQGLRTPADVDAAREAWRQALQRFQASVEPRPYAPRLPSPSHRAPPRPRVPIRRRVPATRARRRGKWARSA